MSRLWKKWEARFFESGTTVVSNFEPHKPNLYVYADAGIDEDRQQRDRYAMCKALQDFMNGGSRPVWLDDFDRVSEGRAESLSGGSITATGPCIDRNPPRLDWIQDDSDEAKSDRARLMDVLFSKEKSSS